MAGHVCCTSHLNEWHKSRNKLSEDPQIRIIVDDAGTVRRISGDQINTLYVMESQQRIPYRKVGHLLRFDFGEIVEWTKDKEK